MILHGGRKIRKSGGKFFSRVKFCEYSESVGILVPYKSKNRYLEGTKVDSMASGNFSRQGSKGRRFESLYRRNFFALFFKVSQIFKKTTFLGVKKHGKLESGVKKIPTQRKPL